MGCFLSRPDTSVHVTEGRGKNFIYATASCQGWRREQEDAEVCLPNFDQDVSLFVLCDGHGGAEVAKYTVEHLPDFIKNHQLYKEKNYEKLLHVAFKEFDALLRTDDVLAELNRIAFDRDENEEKESKVLDVDRPKETDSPEPSGSAAASTTAAGSSTSSKNGPSTVVEDVEVDTLRKEAQVPLTDLIEVYSDKVGLDPAKKRSLMLNYHASPVVKSKETDKDSNTDNNGETTNITSSEDLENKPEPSSSKLGGDEPEQGPSSSARAELASDIRQIFQSFFSDEDSSDDSEFNGAEDDDDDDDDGDDEDDDQGSANSSKRLRRKKHKRPSDDYDSTSEDYSEENEDEEGDEEEGSESDEESDSDEEFDFEGEEGVNGSGDEDGSDEYSKWGIPDMMKSGARQHRPGFDSGCTVVVTLITNDTIYVASAGDSRCITISRSGSCTPMSFDHKPTDPIERKRIFKAGGRVHEGRVNGGLNLSRAFGDFTYKRFNLPAEEQMITPCPDLKIAPFNPKDIKYVVLACDGIWNSMENDKVASHIYSKEPTCGSLVDVCLTLFQTCIAPTTDGDGTGCDNMTCIIAKFDEFEDTLNQDSDLKRQEDDPEADGTPSTKRSNADRTNDTPVKRRCIRLWDQD